MVVRLPGCPFFGVFFVFGGNVFPLHETDVATHFIQKCLCFVCFNSRDSCRDPNKSFICRHSTNKNPLYLVFGFFGGKIISGFAGIAPPPFLWLTKKHLGTITVVFVVVGSPPSTSRPKNPQNSALAVPWLPP